MVAAAAPAIQRAGGLEYVRVPAAALGAILRPAAAGGEATGQGAPLTAAQARAHAPWAEAVLDGAMFVECGRSDAPSSYTRYTCGQVEYRLLDRRHGVDVPSRHPSRGVTLAVDAAGRASAADGSAVPGDAVFAAQLYPALVRRGANVASDAPGTNGRRLRRAGVAVLSDGTMVLATAPAATMREFAEALRALGAVDAGYSDGGGSTRLETSAGGTAGSSENRRVPAWLGADTDPQPGTTQPAPPPSPGPTPPPAPGPQPPSPKPYDGPPDPSLVKREALPAWVPVLAFAFGGIVLAVFAATLSLAGPSDAA